MNKKPPFMHDNFEKEVQQKMEELQLTPSAPVWEKVEFEIREEKKKRRGIFWFLFAGLLLAGGGWWSYQSLSVNGKQTHIESTVPVKKSSPDRTSVPTSTFPQLTSSADSAYKPAFVKTTQQLIKKSQSNSINTIVNEQKSFAGKTVEIGKPTSVQTLKSKEPIVIPSIERDEKQGSQIAGVKPIAITTSTNETTSQTKITDSLIVVKPQIPLATDSVVKIIISKEVTPLAAIDSLLKKKAAANKKWKKQASINIGRSSYISGLFVNGATRMNDPLQSSSSGVTPNIARPSPANIAGGFAFAAGFHLLKQVSKKWEIIVGLQYSFYSTKTRLGDKKTADTAVSFNMDKMAVDEFYTNTGRNNYTSRFHVVEIPVSFSYQPVQKVPFHISAGISYGRLLSTNALTYSKASNLYYENKENYNRDYVPVTASVQYSFGGKKGIAVKTGPVIQYNMLKLQKEAVTNIPHLFFAGLKTDISF